MILAAIGHSLAGRVNAGAESRWLQTPPVVIYVSFARLPLPLIPKIINFPGQQQTTTATKGRQISVAPIGRFFAWWPLAGKALD